ncbi:unnamed protein product [Allacma fusca]|uniref:Uncharacterized protein n=1 Tax=Allacma fusca TaxID=39272 RepID=A0A8J2NSR5_9HEXA|nr:unnamed protein product [Allacma fusca]
MDIVLNTLLIISWLIGYFPAQNPLESSPYFQFKWKSLITAYSAVFVILTTLIMVDTVGGGVKNTEFKTSAIY